MRVLITGCGSRGDTEPLVALAVRLRDLGAEVRMCLPPDYVERCAEVGVPLVTVGRPVRESAREPGELPPGAPESAAEVVDEWFDEVPEAAEGCDAVVTTGLLPAAVAVRSVAEKLGIPYSYLALCPIHLPSWLDPERRELYNQGSDQWFGDVVNSRRAALGLPPVENLFDFGSTDRPWLAADPALAPLPPGQEAVQTGAWLLPDERPLPVELEAFLAAGSPPVYVGFGSSPGTVDAARVAIEAIRAQGRRVVLSHGWSELALPDDGSDCFSVGDVNLRLLFGRVAAAVHHDGAGTTHVATQAGAPQIVVRHIVGQVYYADRVAELGVGAAIDGPVPTLDSFSAALVTALAPDTRERATAVAATLRTDGAAVAAGLLLDAVSREQPAVPA
ncbi:glycosyltransferase [Umezawaea endophytica]|uniref:Glycosyltransferase n=1 Tax=Umezawaea endophytica TaxID=1654476 RepID=A0A9X2VJN4_9PSEU|nr:glycosyltransferase [Umezawaea endophytica]MCS7477858.1 glycosyltransferase [Umezawaea endophytica]